MAVLTHPRFTQSAPDYSFYGGSKPACTANFLVPANEIFQVDFAFAGTFGQGPGLYFLSAFITRSSALAPISRRPLRISLIWQRFRPCAGDFARGPMRPGTGF